MITNFSSDFVSKNLKKFYVLVGNMYNITMNAIDQKLNDYRRAITAEIVKSKKVPKEVSYNEVSEYVNDAFAYLFIIYKDGKLSFPSFAWKYAKDIAVKHIKKDYYRRLSLILWDALTGEKCTQRKHKGKHKDDTPQCRIEPIKDIREVIEERSDIEYLKEVTRDRERKLIDYMLADLRYEEIASKLGISKGTVTKHLRKLAKYFKE